MPGGKAGKTSIVSESEWNASFDFSGKDHGKSKAKAVSRSARAGLQFPVGKFDRTADVVQLTFTCSNDQVVFTVI